MLLAIYQVSAVFAFSGIFQLQLCQLCQLASCLPTHSLHYSAYHSSVSAPRRARQRSMATWSSVAGPSSIAYSAAALPSASIVENGSEAAPSSGGEAAAAPPAGEVASNGEDQEMTMDSTDNAPEADAQSQAAVEVVGDELAPTAASSTASSSSTTAATNTNTATSLPTPSTTEPPLSAPAAPPSSSDGRKAPRAAKVKANAMVSLGSDGLEGSLSASEGPATPVVPNTAPLSRAKRQKNVKFR